MKNDVVAQKAEHMTTWMYHYNMLQPLDISNKMLNETPKQLQGL